MQYQLIIDYTIGEYGYSMQYIRSVLDRYRGQHVDVKISSLGGDAAHALDIRQQFIDHGDVTVYYTGFSASAATVIATGAKKIVMSKYALILVHKCSLFVDAWGRYNADEMADLMQHLTTAKQDAEKTDVILANIYAKRCGKPVSDILAILKEGKWLNADDALALGLIDEVSEVADENPTMNETMGNRVTALGLPPIINQQLMTKKVEKYDFSHIANILGMETIVADHDGDVTLRAEDFARLEAHVRDAASAETAASDKDTTIAERDKTIAELTAQVAALQNAPGDDTADVDGVNDTAAAPSAINMYNDIKKLL